MTCPVCGDPCSMKDPSKPGPQRKYCGRRCQTIASHRARRARVAAAQRDAARLAAIEDRLIELEAFVSTIDWARIPAAALGNVDLVRYQHAAREAARAVPAA
jgi:endogenous inhibitor of DNA gyrase (YacG/DUF329 family)